jgi:hypothetical protein
VHPRISVSSPPLVDWRMFTNQLEERHLAQHRMVMRRLVRIAPAPAFEVRPIGFGQPSNSASSSAIRAMSVQLSTAADWITSHQTEAPPTFGRPAR